MDGECTVRLYCDVTDSWVPIFVGASTLKDDESDFLWPIAVLERPSPTFRYVYCRHAKYPSVGKNAIPITVPWSIPLLDAVVFLEFYCSTCEKLILDIGAKQSGRTASTQRIASTFQSFND